MPPPRTGSVEPFKRADGTVYYRARIRLGDGTRVRVDVPEKYSRAAGGKSGEERAELYALASQEREDETGELLKAKRERAAEEAKKRDEREGETCEKYFARHTEAREAEGVRDTRKERTIWGKWLSPRIGARPIAGVTGVTREEVERIRDALDAQVRLRIKEGLAAGISGATAQNVWSVLRTMFKEAMGSRDRTLRVRTDDPTHGHKPPLKTPRRQKTFIYPTEFAKLLACADEDVPRQWREVYAVAAYTYVRPEELQALTWRDVDFAAGTLQISKATDARTGKPKELPKTENAVRAVPLEPALVPLLERMRKGADEGAPILPVLGELNDKFRAKQFRDHLRLAGVTRARLFADTVTLLPIDFRSCRDTGITWLALAGLDVGKIQRRAGHEDLSTTLGYVKMAEDLGGKVGTPFAPLPGGLVQPTFGPSKSRPIKNTMKMVPEEGIEGAPIVVSTRNHVDSRSDDAPRVDVSARNQVDVGPSKSAVEDALAGAIADAARAGRWDVVAQLARELEARRLAEAGVTRLEDTRARR
jgi:integrase